MSFSSRVQVNSMSLRCVLLVAAALFSGAAFALPTDVVFHVCRTAGHFEAGAAWDAEPECPDRVDFGITIAELEPDFQVMAHIGGELYWYPVDEMLDSYSLYVERGEDILPLLWSESGYVPPDDPGPGGGLPDEIDVEAFSAAFTGAFMICALFWGLGKGVSTVVNFLRRT